MPIQRWILSLTTIINPQERLPGAGLEAPDVDFQLSCFLQFLLFQQIDVCLHLLSGGPAKT